MIYFAFFYGAFTLLGGLMGYLKAKSKASLMAGGLSGLLIILATYGIVQHQVAGYYGLLAVSALLGIYFGMKFFKTFKLMPAGLIFVLSAITLIGFLVSKPAFMAPHS